MYPRPSAKEPTVSKLVRLHAQRDAVEWITATDPAADLRDPDVRAAARR